MRSIVEIVRERAEQSSDRLAVTTFSRRSKPASRTFAELADAAANAAAFYHEHGLQRGEVVVFLGTHHIDFYAAWLGCVWLGAIPTVLAEPSVRIAREIYWARLGELLARIDAWGIARDPKLAVDPAQIQLAHAYAYDTIAAGAGSAPAPVEADPGETLLLQHSSGTTGLHKGVMLSHGAVWKHAESYHRAIQLADDDRIASWLPLYHDMGFIACFVNPLLAGVPVVWLSPFEWVANPGLLLDAVQEHRATLAWLPNFAFAFLAQRVKSDPGQRDLSSLRALINCSEPVSAEAMRLFAERFSADGLRPAALQTCYAMAENVFAVSTSTAGQPPRQRRIDREIWHSQHRAQVSSSDGPGSVVHVSNGPCVEHCAVRVVDAQSAPLPPNVAGRILIRSPFLFNGYFRRDDLNSGLFDAEGFYDTGDLGYLDEMGHVYVTGRAKDLVIVGGKNIYPQDVEQIVASVSGVYPGRVVVFGVEQRDLGTEGLVVLVESELPPDQWAETERQIRLTVPARLDVDVFDARVVPRMELRKSTSGKLARDGNRQWYLDGRFGSISPQIQTEV